MSASGAFRDFELAGWSSASVAAAYHRHLAELTSGCIPELLCAAGVRAGARVLDVACGAGYVAAAAHDRGADAIGIDFSAAQIRLATQSYPGLRFIEGDAEALPFAGGNFDAVFNAFGLPHSPNPDRVMTETYRVLKPAGRFAYASWCEATKCIAFAMVYDAIRAHGSLDVGLPPGPNFFACGDLGCATEMLVQAGFADVAGTELPLVWRVTAPDEFIDIVSSGTVRASAALKRQSPANLTKIRQYLRERISDFETGGVYLVPSPALVVTARKPH